MNNRNCQYWEKMMAQILCVLLEIKIGPLLWKKVQTRSGQGILQA